ncbi:hypothetical protein ACH347_12695 [Saccharopolyspora sp. 5N102]|uniref:hypothetical protein n=1 Tax=Saccharopolyspora sp. 5N102 TaxID=3375155 RepID=UPI00379917B0
MSKEDNQTERKNQPKAKAHAEVEVEVESSPGEGEATDVRRDTSRQADQHGTSMNRPSRRRHEPSQPKAAQASQPKADNKNNTAEGCQQPGKAPTAEGCQYPNTAEG